jgi:hypothetical protein
VTIHCKYGMLKMVVVYGFWVMESLAVEEVILLESGM